ncbi:hypothetical protein, partial [Komagataeibacter europaeus]|uniref:hypothetical protein n=1 Tax=Komagataeibacter europaeus TaxID=33995 RepID=UPI000474C414
SIPTVGNVSAQVGTVQANLTSAVAAQANENSSLQSQIDGCVTGTTTDNVAVTNLQMFYYTGEDNSTAYMQVETPSGLVSIPTVGNVSAQVGSSGTITGGTYTRIGSVLRQKFTVTIPSGTGTSDHTITFPMAFSSVPSVTLTSSRELEGDYESTVVTLYSETEGSTDFITETTVSFRINSFVSTVSPSPNSVVVVIDAEGIG